MGLFLEVLVLLTLCVAPALLMLGLLFELANLGIQMIGDTWHEIRTYLREYDV